ncbi:MAG: hypothetical protein Q8S02_01195 [Hydrogenophaga sp.]|nr:hypothetical protein [Hydrogenophaga sp.]
MDLYLAMIGFGILVMVLSLCVPQMDRLIEFLESCRHRDDRKPPKP